jgi:ribulose-bisphosphate carboxylase large chain
VSEDSLRATYRLRVPATDLNARVDALLLEQTVEVPRSVLARWPEAEAVVGQVLATEQADEQVFIVTVAQPSAAISDPAQLLNVLFGNASLQPDVALLDVEVPEAIVRSLGGPRFGLAGWRKLTGVAGRALTCSALKPLGLSVEQLAQLCTTFALAGVDVIKDDHGLGNHPFCPFAERVQTCLTAVELAAEKTGRRALYVPNLVGPPRTVLEQAQLCRRLGVRAIMVAPMLLGLPVLNELADAVELPVLAHPAFSGGRVAEQALLGRLFPLYGADGVIFPSFGGRFSYGKEVCGELARRLLRPQGAIAPALPVAGGGISTTRVGEALAFYGADAMLLIGGSLLEAGDDLFQRSSSFVDQVRQYPYSE